MTGVIGSGGMVVLVEDESDELDESKGFVKIGSGSGLRSLVSVDVPIRSGEMCLFLFQAIRISDVCSYGPSSRERIRFM